MMPSDPVPTNPKLRALYEAEKRRAELQVRLEQAEKEKATADSMIQSYKAGKTAR